MPKYYLQSGTLQAVIHSTDPRRAAMWAIQRAMDAVLPGDDECVVEMPMHAMSSRGRDMVPNHRRLEVHTPARAATLVALGPSIALSEVGFDQPDAMQIDTLEAFREWHALVEALDQVASLL